MFSNTVKYKAHSWKQSLASYNHLPHTNPKSVIPSMHVLWQASVHDSLCLQRFCPAPRNFKEPNTVQLSNTCILQSSWPSKWYAYQNSLGIFYKKIYPVEGYSAVRMQYAWTSNILLRMSRKEHCRLDKWQIVMWSVEQAGDNSLPQSNQSSSAAACILNRMTTWQGNSFIIQSLWTVLFLFCNAVYRTGMDTLSFQQENQLKFSITLSPNYTRI
jgi:hypothetical protein